MPDDLAAQLGTPVEGAQLRTGTVVALLGASQVIVDLGGGQQADMPALTGYEPIPGDVVQILQQGSVQLVLGRTNPMSGANALANPTFELDAAGVAPTSWTKVIDPSLPTGNATVKTDNASGWGPIHGSKWLELDQTTVATAFIHMVSEPIPVVAGQIWTAAGYALNASTDAGGGSCAIRLAYFADNTTMYPTVVAPDAVITTVNWPQGGIPGWTLLRQWYGIGFVIPTGATWLRVVLSTVLVGGVGSAAYWDGIICRQVNH